MKLTIEDIITIGEGIKCPSCGKQIGFDEFRDEISLKEWRLSKLCQDCQDEVFGIK